MKEEIRVRPGRRQDRSGFRKYQVGDRTVFVMVQRELHGERVHFHGELESVEQANALYACALEFEV